MSLEIEGKNWCRKYDHEIDYELVHQICETPHPKGCANCEFNDYRISITKSSEVGEGDVRGYKARQAVRGEGVQLLGGNFGGKVDGEG